MENPQQQRITRWLLIMALLIIVLIAVSLLIPSPDGQDAEIQLAGGASNSPTPTNTRFPTQPLENPIDEPPTDTPFPTVTSPPNSALTPTPQKNCVYPAFYWREHPEAWVAENIVIGQSTYTKDEAIEILETDSDDLPTNVLKQVFSAILNVLKGADPSRIENTLMTAIEWLDENSPGDSLSESGRQAGIALLDTLQSYNTGQSGPELCADVPRTPTPEPAATSTPTATSTATVAITFPPPATETPTEEPEEERTPLPPTDTPPPPATDTPEPPTDTPPPPPPTDTPEPPTPAPPPTTAPPPPP